MWLYLAACKKSFLGNDQLAVRFPEIHTVFLFLMGPFPSAIASETPVTREPVDTHRFRV